MNEVVTIENPDIRIARDDLTTTYAVPSVEGWQAGPGVTIKPASDGRPNMITISAELPSDGDEAVVISPR